jgi:hypothetical protein
MSGSKHSQDHRCLGALVVLVNLLWNGVGTCKAAEGDSDCSAVYDAALEREAAGSLHDAIDMFRNCAADSCSNPGRETCRAKLFRLELDVPSVVPLVKDEAGAPLVDVQVTMDGARLASRLDGRAISIDPGLHEFVFRTGHDGEALIGRTRLVIAQGERNRTIWMTRTNAAPVASVTPAERVSELPASTSALQPRIQTGLAPITAVTSSEPSSHGGSVAPYLLAGTALIGTGAYLLLSSWARSDNQQLGRCTPNCSEQSVSHIRSLYLIADASLGVAAAAALSSAAWFIFSRSSADSTDKRPPAQGSYALSVQPERAGALATLRGSF